MVAYTRLRESVRQLECRITGFGEAADADDTWQWSINRLRKSNCVPSAIPKKSLAIASRGARRLEDLPKSCHLLPSTAISEPQNRYVRFNRSISFVAPRGRAGQPGPRAENRERGQDEPRWDVAIECGAKLERTFVAPITVTDRGVMAHVRIPAQEAGVTKASVILTDQVRSTSIQRLGRKLRKVSASTMTEVEQRLAFLLGL
jgi:mRNA-degrading endonuclease toxin of MazEF toxin-antitoxin module